MKFVVTLVITGTSVLLLLKSLVLKYLDNHKHICVITDTQGNPILWGYNYYDLSKCSIHAEEDGIKKLIYYLSRKGYKRHIKYNVYIFRFNENGDLLMSRPCNKCQIFLEKYSYLIDKIFYSNNNGEIVKY